MSDKEQVIELGFVEVEKLNQGWIQR